MKDRLSQLFALQYRKYWNKSMVDSHIASNRFNSPRLMLLKVRNRR